MSNTTMRDALALIVHHETGDQDAVADMIAATDHQDRGLLIARLLTFPHLRTTVHHEAPSTADWAARLMHTLEHEGTE